ncbi:MAG: lipoyl(octanoyl) transferase LipB [Fidelibacterota bacterium]
MNPISEITTMKYHQMPGHLSNHPVDTFHDISSVSEELINFFWLGKQAFHPVWELQKLIHDSIVAEQINDVVLLLEHDPVYTFGKNANRDHLLPTYSKDAEVLPIDRGGDVTFHGPGQLVIYPILNLKNYRQSVSWYMRSLEKVIIRTLAMFGISAVHRPGLTGVWVDDDKICAMGVRLSRWVTMHGLALNVSTNLTYFDGIIPCGLFDCGVTSVKKQTNKDIRLLQVVGTFIPAFIDIFQPGSKIQKVV